MLGFDTGNLAVLYSLRHERAPVAQWIECKVADLEVGGSNPFRRVFSLFPNDKSGWMKNVTVSLPLRGGFPQESPGVEKPS